MNFKQFFNLLKQQRLFSGIYVTCTALSTALTMTLFLVIYIMVGPVYPEQERSRMAVMKHVQYESKAGAYSCRASATLADSLRRMPEVECVTAIEIPRPKTVFDTDGEPVTCMLQLVDDSYWKVFNFRFVCGRAFTHEEWEANSPVCVISESLARRVFGRTDVVGRTLDTEDESTCYSVTPGLHLRIVGVVRDVSMAMPLTCAHCWRPQNLPSFDSERAFQGGCTLAMLLHKGKTMTQLQERVDRLEECTNREQEAAGSEYQVKLHGYLKPHWQSSLVNPNTEEWKPALRKILGMLLAFLLIPAMNMSSMVASRINARISELGIRRAYGASRAALLWQVLEENFLLTLAGSLIGLAISWLIVALGSEWLPFIFNQEGRYLADVAKSSVNIHADMLFSGRVLAAVVVAALVLNLVSALVPTMWTLHKSVTEEINTKR